MTNLSQVERGQGVNLHLELLRPETTEVELPTPMNEYRVGVECDTWGVVSMGRGPESLPGFKQNSFTFIYFMKKVIGEIFVSYPCASKYIL